MKSQVLNFLWLNLELPAPPDPAEGLIREPLPAKYIENVRKAGARHPAAEIDLWVDSQRLTEKQMDYLRHAIENECPNVHLQDLRSIPEYNKNPVFNKAETNPDWRDEGQRSLIWGQVDAAKILISLQGNFDQTFFADLDHAHIDIDSFQVQDMIGKHGLFIGSAWDDGVGVENQLWGFDRTRRNFFEHSYSMAWKSASLGLNAWKNFEIDVNTKLVIDEGIPLEEICLPIGNDGTQAEQTGVQWRDGNGTKAEPSLIAVGQLTRAFKENSEKGKAVNPSVGRRPKTGTVTLKH